MPAYVLIDADVTDDDRYAAYAAAGGRILPDAGGRFLVRGGAIEVLEGAWRPRRLVVIEFPDRATARAWYGSAAYRQARALREGAAAFRAILVEGLPAGPAAGASGAQA